MQEERRYNVKLHGFLAEEYGEQEFTLWARNMQEVMRGLVSIYGRKFRDSILHGAWHVVLDKSKEISEQARSLTENLLDFPIKEEYRHIIPVIQGAGGPRGGGLFSIILGVVLIAAAVVTAGATGMLAAGEFASAGAAIGASSVASSLAVAGVMSMIGGIMSLIVPVPKMNYGVAQRQSFIFNGPVNNTNQGVPVPVIYGECMTGSTVISADIQTTNVNWNMLTAQQVIDGVAH
jgi:predicted phage tail protein